MAQMLSTRKQLPHAVSALRAGSLVCLVLVAACARSDYRKAADRESYCLISSRAIDPRWEVPNRSVEPKAHSRMYIGAEKDCGPKPIDDAAAKRYMDHPDCFDNTKYYSKIPSRAGHENPIWTDYLTRNAEGQIELTPTLAIDLSLLHSREYQSAFETVYLQALNLSNDRFEFDTQWAGGLGAGFRATGSDLGNQRRLDVTTSRLGLERNLASGGQFATGILNGLFWDFGSSGISGGSAALVTTFTQPLLRGAFRHVRLEDLTQSERNLLYSVREFARFRRLFYVDISTSYLNLLTQAQAIRNTRTNVENLRQNLVEHRDYAELETVSQVQVDQVFQEYQRGRISLLEAEQRLVASQDQFKFQLGLPAWIPLEIDESLLDPFELVDPRLEALDAEVQVIYEELVKYLPPVQAPKELLRSTYDKFVAMREEVAEVMPSVQDELLQWKTYLKDIDSAELTSDDRLDYEQQVELSQDVESALALLQETLNDREQSNRKVLEKIEAYEAESPQPAREVTEDSMKSLLEALDAKELNEVTLEDILPGQEDSPSMTAWKAIEQAVGRQLREELAELYVAQTQIRLFLIAIDPQEIREPTAITYAHQNRLDLMNSKALVMDAYRKVEVAADALESDLSLSGSVVVGSDPTINNAYRFDSSSNQYRVGVEFDGPLNRRNERNNYRATQITYQRTSRDFIAAKDQVANSVRSVLRQLELRRLNFLISRQQVVAATRQVDLAQIDLRRSTESDANLTLILLQALEGLLEAKNNLISNWIGYRIQKMRLFAELEMLYLDENGNWINEETGLDVLADFNVIDPDYFPVGWLVDDEAANESLNGETPTNEKSGKKSNSVEQKTGVTESTISSSRFSASETGTIGNPPLGRAQAELVPLPTPNAPESGISDSGISNSSINGIVTPSPPFTLQLDR